MTPLVPATASLSDRLDARLVFGFGCERGGGFHAEASVASKRVVLLDPALALAKEYGLAARVWLDDGRRKVRALGKPVVDNAFLDSYSIGLDDKAASYERMLRALPPGLNEWAVHPAHGTEQWQTIEPTGWRIRQTDHSFPTSAQAREILDEERITVIDYRPLQQAWNV